MQKVSVVPSSFPDYKRRHFASQSLHKVSLEPLCSLPNLGTEGLTTSITVPRALPTGSKPCVTGQGPEVKLRGGKLKMNGQGFFFLDGE